MFSGVVNRVSVTVWLACSIVASLAGPFLTYETMTLPLRAIYWSTLIALSILLSYALRTGIVATFPDISRNQLDLLLPLVFTLVFSSFITLINHQIESVHTHALSFLEVAGFVLSISIMVTLIKRFLDIDPRPVNPAPKVAPRPRLVDRLSLADDLRVHRLTVDNHYVIVVTSDGQSHRLLMRFADAVAEMEGQEGLLTHRSHWVSLDMVAGVCRESGREVVVLKSGGHIPLSRTYRDAFEARGFAAPPVKRIAETVGS